MESEMKIRLTSLGWGGISLLVAGYSLLWVAIALADYTVPRSWQWWGAGLPLFMSLFAMVLGLFTAFVGSWLKVEAKPQRRLEAQMKGT